jgi:type I restriction enzyme M protein
MNQNGNNIESRLWETADELRANSELTSNEYSVPELGLVFLRYADHKLLAAVKELEGAGSGRCTIGPAELSSRGCVLSSGGVTLFKSDSVTGRHLAQNDNIIDTKVS